MKLKIAFLTLTLLLVNIIFSQNENCLDLDGDNDYIHAGNINNLGTSDFTIEAWVYFNNSFDGGDGYKIINKGLTSVGVPTNAGYSLRGFSTPLGSDLDFSLGHSDGSVARVTYSGLSINTWYHVAGVRKGRSLQLYVDGILVGSTLTTVVYNVDTNLPLTIGAIHKGGLSPINEFMDGKIDEIRIWETARTQVQLFNNKDCAITSPIQYLLTVYNLNEGNQSMVYDASGNNMDASIENNPIWTNSTVALECINEPSEISKETSIKLEVFPNPFYSEIHINIVLENTKYCIYDLTGKLVLQGIINGNTIYNTELLNSGNYILEIEINGQLIRKKIIKVNQF